MEDIGLQTLQILLAFAMFLATAAAGLIPIKLLHFIYKQQASENRKASWILTLLSCFAGGVFMGTCFLDIFPGLNHDYKRFRANAGWSAAYPFPEFFVCCGFFLVYFLEEISLKLFSAHSHGHSHVHHSHTKGNGISGVKQPLKSSHANATTGLDGRDSRSSSVGAADAEQAADDMADGGAEDKCVAQMHERVMDETVAYLSNGLESGGIMTSLTFVIAMSFHSFLEGFALGVQETYTGIMTLFFSLLIHKGVEAFSVGLQISKSNPKKIWQVVLTIVAYALMTPAGSMVGVLIRNCSMDDLLKDGIVIVLGGFAGGTFIYVTFFEVLAQERANDHSNLIQLVAIIVGFLVIAALQVNEHFLSASSAGPHGH